MSQSRVALVVLFFAAFLVPTSPAQAASTVLCSGYSSCAGKGYSHGGYEARRGTSYWNMYTGTNCTNYVAYRLVTTNGLPNKRPKPGVGNARDWGTAMASVTDSRPTVGSVAWWGRTGNHVAYVEKVVSPTEIWVSESNWSGAFDWRKITKSGSGWPDGFIHFDDPKIVNSTKPAIVGTVRVGTKLTAAGGVWSPKGNTYAYQWLADGKAISGASAKTFTPTASQLAKDLTATVTATRPGFPTARATSAAVEVEPGRLSVSDVPTIDGTPRVGSPLTARPGTWSPTGTTHSYQWLVGGAPAAGATGASFTPGGEAAGLPVSVKVTTRKSGYTSLSSTSAATADVAVGSVASTARPTVSGTARVGSRLTASPGTWSVTGLSYAYQWHVDGIAVEAATGPTFVPRAADIGRPVTVHVTAGRPGYTPATAHSLATATVARGVITAGTRPTVSGNERVGSRLTATTGSWSPASTYSFQWYADGRLIDGATGRSFIASAREHGAKLRVRVTARREGYTTVTAQSVNTGRLATGTIRVTAPPVLTGSSRLGQVLTVAPGAHTPSGATLRYQWLRDGKALPGATSRNHRVKTGDLGRRLAVKVTLSAAGHHTRSVTTAASAVVKATSTVKVSATKPGKGKVTFSVRVTANGVAAPDGKATITYSPGRTRTVLVKSGRATLALTGQPAGLRSYPVTYSGTSTVTSAKTVKTLTIL